MIASMGYLLLHVELWMVIRGMPFSVFGRDPSGPVAGLRLLPCVNDRFRPKVDSYAGFADLP